MTYKCYSHPAQLVLDFYIFLCCSLTLSELRTSSQNCTPDYMHIMDAYIPPLLTDKLNPQSQGDSEPDESSGIPLVSPSNFFLTLPPSDSLTLFNHPNSNLNSAIHL